MLWTVQLRNTAQQLVKAALAAQGANVDSDRVNPAPAQSGGGTTVSLYVDDDMEGQYGGAPEFLTHARLTIEIVAEAAPAAAPAPPQSAAQALRDALIETVKSALLGGQGFVVPCAVSFGSAEITPASTAGIVAGFAVIGQGAGQGNFVQSVNADGSLTLASPIVLPGQAGSTGTLQLNFGSFVLLYEQIDQVKTYLDDGTFDRKNYVFGATIEIRGHTHERFELATSVVLNGINVYLDAVNAFDPGGAYSGQEGPFAGTPAPRSTGPDGRPEAVLPLAIPQE